MFKFTEEPMPRFTSLELIKEKQSFQLANATTTIHYMLLDTIVRQNRDGGYVMAVVSEGGTFYMFSPKTQVIPGPMVKSLEF